MVLIASLTLPQVREAVFRALYQYCYSPPDSAAVQLKAAIIAKGLALNSQEIIRQSVGRGHEECAAILGNLFEKAGSRLQGTDALRVGRVVIQFLSETRKLTPEEASEYYRRFDLEAKVRLWPNSKFRELLDKELRLTN